VITSKSKPCKEAETRRCQLRRGIGFENEKFRMKKFKMENGKFKIQNRGCCPVLLCADRHSLVSSGVSFPKPISLLPLAFEL